LYQYIDVVITLGILDSADVYEESLPTPITITGKAGHTIGSGTLRKAFSYTITEAMVTDTSINGIAPKSRLDFSLDDQGTITTLTDGAASSATHDVDATTGIFRGNSINWSVDKTPLFSEEAISEIQIGAVGGVGTNIDNLTVGMILSAPNIRSGDNVTITAVNTTSVTISEEITTNTSIDITFTASGITVYSVTDGDTFVATQSLNLTDNFSLTFGGQEADLEAYVSGATSTQSGDNVILAGFFVVDSFPLTNKTVSIDINKLITITDTP